MKVQLALISDNFKLEASNVNYLKNEKALIVCKEGDIELFNAVGDSASLPEKAIWTLIEGGFYLEPVLNVLQEQQSFENLNDLDNFIKSELSLTDLEGRDNLISETEFLVIYESNLIKSS